MSLFLKVIAGAVCVVLLPLVLLTPATGPATVQQDNQTATFSNQPDRPDAAYVSVTKVEQTSGRELQRSYAGTVVARRSSDVGFNQTGRIVSLMVDQGDTVEKDQELAKLDLDELRAVLGETTADRLAAQSQLLELEAGPRKQTIEAAKLKVKELASLRDQSKRWFERVASLSGTDAIATREIDDARHQLAAAESRLLQQKQVLDELIAGTRSEQIESQKAAVEKLNASIKRLEVLINQGTLKAPFAGIVAKRFVDDGSVVDPGSVVFRIVETQFPEAWIGIPEARISALKESQLYEITVGPLNYPAKLLTVLPEVDESTRTRTAIFQLLVDSRRAPENPLDNPAIGSLAQLSLTQSIQTEGIWIPLAALTRGTRGLWAAFVVVSEKGELRVQRRDVEILQVDSNQVLVRGGLQDGDLLVISGVQKLTNDQRVQLAP